MKVQLRLIVDDDDNLRRVMAEALITSNSTSVLLKTVAALRYQAEHADVREALARTLSSGFSTSVVLASLESVEDYVREDPAVRDAFRHAMEDEDLSSTGRVRGGERLLPHAEERGRERIADAMEDVIVGASRRLWGRNDAASKALRLLEQIDRQRAEQLRTRYR